MPLSRRPARRRACALALLAEAELTVSDLTDILRQSQPRISRHLKLLAEAGLVERFREGTWAFFRLAEHGGGAEVARALIERLNPADQTIARDRDRLTSVRQARAAAAQAYFRAHAAEWDRIRKLHVTDEAVEDAIRAALADKPFRSLLDLGTGTGRMLEMFGPDLERVHSIVLGASGRDDDDRRADPFVARRLDQLPAVHARQHQVEDADVGPLVAQPRQPLRAVADRDRVESGGAEVPRHSLRDDFVVFDDEDLGHACVHYRLRPVGEG